MVGLDEYNTPEEGLDQEGNVLMTNAEMEATEQELDELFNKVMEAMEGEQMETEFGIVSQVRPG